MFDQTATLVGIGAAFNVTAQIKKEGDPFATLLGAGALLGALAVIGQTFDWRIATTLAGLYSFGSFIANGEDLIDVLARLSTSSGTTTKTKGKP